MVRLDPAIPKDRSEILRIIKDEWSLEEISIESFAQQPLSEGVGHVFERKTPLGSIYLILPEI